MQRNKTIIGMGLLPLLLSSCITTLNPLVTSKNIAKYDEVIGKWQTRDYNIIIERYFGSNLEKSFRETPGSKQTAAEVIQKMPADQKKIFLNTYLVRFNKNGILHLMGLKFARINNDLYAQVEGGGFALRVPGDDISPSDTADDVLLDIFPNAEPAYTIAKVTLDKNVLQLRFVNTDFVETLLNKGAIAIKYEEDDLFDTKVITASSEELEKFLSKYGKDDRLYSAENTILLQRKLHY